VRMKRRLTVVPVLVIVGLALLGLSGCGGSGTASASDVATQYVRDVLAGKGLAACSLMTPAERRNSNAFWALAGSTRYAQAGSVATSCSQYYAGLTSSEEFGAGLPALTRVVRSSVTGAHATVTFAPPSDDLGFSFMGMTDRDQLSLTSIGGRWEWMYKPRKRVSRPSPSLTPNQPALKLGMRRSEAARRSCPILVA